MQTTKMINIQFQYLRNLAPFKTVQKSNNGNIIETFYNEITKLKGYAQNIRTKSIKTTPRGRTIITNNTKSLVKYDPQRPMRTEMIETYADGTIIKSFYTPQEKVFRVEEIMPSGEIKLNTTNPRTEIPIAKVEH